MSPAYKNATATASCHQPKLGSDGTYMDKPSANFSAGLPLSVKIIFAVIGALIICGVIWAVARGGCCNSPKSSKHAHPPPRAMADDHNFARQLAREYRVQDQAHNAPRSPFVTLDALRAVDSPRSTFPGRFAAGRSLRMDSDTSRVDVLQHAIELQTRARANAIVSARLPTYEENLEAGMEHEGGHEEEQLPAYEQVDTLAGRKVFPYVGTPVI